jgi:hypothetical protein
VVAKPTPVPTDLHEWVTFEDPDEERTWVFDVTFLASNWTCIFAAGCQGVLTGPAPELVQGCCSYGAHFTGEEDVERVMEAAATLTEDDWQHIRKGRTKAGELRITRVNKDGDTVTRMVDGACIFLNRPDFEAGAGCALHRGALRQGKRPVDTKPDVCWQLPLRRDDTEDGDGHVTTTVRQWDRKHWGDGGAEFHWWCTESPDAFVGQTAVYQSMRDELVEISGKKVYDRLAAYIEARRPESFTPHPATRVTLRRRR